MIDPATLVTWQGLREAVTGELLNAPGRLDLVPPYQYRPSPFQPMGYGLNQWSGGARLDRSALTKLFAETPRLPKPPAPGAILYCRDGWRAPWRQEIASWPGPYVLVSQFHDAMISEAAANELLGTPAIATWFGVQANATHPKLVAMPIGVDRRMIGSLMMADPRPARERDIVLYANFQRRNPERTALWDQVAGFAVRGEWTPMDPTAYLDAMCLARFVLSPPGLAWDCYRTYEAIACGAIPIVRRQEPASRVVDGLPVLVIDDWAEVTPSRLDAEWRRRDPQPDLAKLTLRYWVQQMKQAARVCVAVESMA